MTDPAPKPPEGYATWLDYAVEAMPTRQLHLEQMLKDLDSDNEPITMRDDFRNAAVAELKELRDRAAKAEQEIRANEREVILRAALATRSEGWVTELASIYCRLDDYRDQEARK